MAEDKSSITQNKAGWRFFGVLALTWTGLTARMVGDTLREIAALVFIFVPLELWRDQSLPHLRLVEFAVAVSLGFFVGGAASQYMSSLAYRFKKDLEGRLDATS